MWVLSHSDPVLRKPEGEEWPGLSGRPALMFCFGFIDVLVLPQGKHSAVSFGVTSGCVWGGDGGTLNWHR